MKIRLYISTFICLFIASACLRLDDNLFNNSKITAYNWDNYTGEQEIYLDESYEIPDSMFNYFTIQSENETIHTVYLGNMNTINKDTVILYCHGNRDHMDFYWNRTKLLAHIGQKNRYGVMTLDYRGYGLSTGTPTEQGMYEDVNSAILWLKSHGLTNERLIIYGFSLGSASATELTANPKSLSPAKLILEAPFASAEVMVHDASLMAMPASYFTNLKIDNAEEIKKVKQPLLWIHGTHDSFLNINTHGEVVYKNHKGISKTAIRVENATHKNIPFVLGYDNYKEQILEFIVN